MGKVYKLDNTVELINYMGDDLMVVNAARVSYGKSKEEFDGKDEKLIKFLIKHKHTSPFRHPQLQFRIKCPIFVERQLFKHQVGLTANSISGRYVDFSDSYDLPTRLRRQSKSSKQGSEGFIEGIQSDALIDLYNDAIKNCADVYKKLCESGVAKEQARGVLPLCLQTQFVWTGSLAAFIHLWSLRLKTDTQQETREVAKMMFDEVQNIKGQPFKYTIRAFQDLGILNL